jgi:ribosomal protein S18 acetylase RimI-like enzyme
MINIRKFNPEHDSEVLQQLESAEWPGADVEHYGPDLPDFYIKKETMLAYEGNELMGFIKVVADMGVVHVDSILVATRARGKGLGKALMLPAEDYAKGLGCHKMWLETGKDWAAVHLYQKMGYTKRVLLENHYGNRDFWYMDKII